jgi:hypothetical protein
MLAPLELAPPEIVPPEIAPPELMAVQTLLLYAPPEPEVCRHLRCHRELSTLGG